MKDSASVEGEDGGGSTDGADDSVGTNGTDGADGPDGSDGKTKDSHACDSDRYWTGGDRESPRMRSGLACIDCRSADRCPHANVADTVFTRQHEPDDCNGVNGVEVVIADARGEECVLRTNGVGNFFASDPQGVEPVWPASVKVASAAGERVMAGGVPTQDCNRYHTVEGADGAPGRIMAPLARGGRP